MKVLVEGFTEVTPVLGSGVYILESQGKVVYVGKSPAMMSMIAGHRRLARQHIRPWFTIPGITFDKVHILPCGPDRATVLVAELISIYAPRYNAKPAKPSPSPSPVGAKIKSRICAIPLAPHA